MSVTLYPDQVEFIGNVRQLLSQLRKIIACAATGFGKSKVFIRIALDAQAKGRTVLILTESRKIFNQIQAEIPATLIDAGSKHFYLPANGIYIGMAQTLCRREELIEQLNLMGENLIIICDEAHMAHFSPILRRLTLAFLIGFTATPDARWARHLPELYKGIVVGPQPHELVLAGRLCSCRHYARVAADLSKLELQKGDFTEQSQEAVFGAAKVFDGMVEDLRKIPYKKCLIFTAGVNDCEKVAAQLNEIGIKCVAVHRGNKQHPVGDKEFDYRLAQFTQLGEVDVCVSVGTLTKGFDFDKIDLICLRRATTSLPLFLQMNGRASRVLAIERLLPVAQRTKQSFTVLDYGGNYLRFGLWDMERDWAELWNKPKKNKEGVAPIKICPVCEYISPASAATCPNCGYEFVKKDVPLEVGKLIEITEIYQTRLVGKQIGSLKPDELAIYAKLKNKKNFATRVARTIELMHIKDGKETRYLDDFAEAMGYKPGWVEWQRKLIPKDGEQSESTGFANFVLA